MKKYKLRFSVAIYFCVIALVTLFKNKKGVMFYFSFVFTSHDREIDHQTNLPIDSEVNTVYSSSKYGNINTIRTLMMYVSIS